MDCYVEARPASGIFAAVPPAEFRPVPTVRSQGVEAPRYRPMSVPAPMPALEAPAVTALRGSPGAPAARNRLYFDFAPGRPSGELFPLKTWRRLLQACLSQHAATGLSQPGDPFGLAFLRSAIANHLAAARGLVVEPGQIVITSGTAEGIALAARVLLTPQALVAIEAPAYRVAASIFAAAGAELCSVPVDDEGLIAADLPARPAVLLYMTPSHQYPTGHTLSPGRAEAIIAWARRTGCYILEDDYGSAFRYEGAAPPALAASAPDCTIHLGTFSQSLGAGLRLGYIVVPPLLVDAVRSVKVLLNSGSPWLEQAAVADFIRSGSYASHLMRMRAAYRERRDHLLASLRRHFGEVEISGEAGGLHLFWQLPPGVPDAATVEALARRVHVGVYSLHSDSVFDAAAGTLARRGVMLGYASLAPKQIEQGIARLSDAVDDALDGHRIGLSDLLAHHPALPRPLPQPSGRRAGKPAPSFRRQPALPPPAVRRAASRTAADQGISAPMPVVTALYHYPIKGLSPQPVRTVRLEAGKPFPFDRVFALARPGMAVTAEAPKWAKKGLFVMLMLDEGLASVRTHLDEKTLLLTVLDGQRPVLSADLTDPEARSRVEAFFHRLAPTLRAAPALVRARDGHFMDKPDNVISLINLATVRSLEQQWGYAIDPLRFRANIYIDGAAPWEEFDWIGSDIRLGEALFRVDRRNGRCGATNVDPATGRRDLDIPGSLRRAFGHKDLGIYLLVHRDADVAVGDVLERPGSNPALRVAEPQQVPAVGRQAFICRGCYFVYDEVRGLPQAGISPGSRFADLPETWPCPDCGTSKSLFRPYTAEEPVR
jgi:GntR family transcriptional regulator/MocR family aminotransferase